MNNLEASDPIPVDKLFMDGYYNDAVIARRKKANDEERAILDGPPEILFTRGACHVYAVRLKLADPRFDLKRLVSSACQGAHIYAFWRGLAIDVMGIRTERDLLNEWQRKGEQFMNFMVDCEKLLEIHEQRDDGKNYNVYGHVVSESYLCEATRKADDHIAANLDNWIRDFPV